VPNPKLPPWERFQKFVGMIVKVPKAEADKAIRTTKGIYECHDDVSKNT
jgi:hypothetical protein